MSRLSAKWHGLPVWAWLAIAAAALVLVVIMRRRAAQAAAVASAQGTDPNAVIDGGQLAGVPSIGLQDPSLSQPFYNPYSNVPLDLGPAAAASPNADQATPAATAPVFNITTLPAPAGAQLTPMVPSVDISRQLTGGGAPDRPAPAVAHSIAQPFVPGGVVALTPGARPLGQAAYAPGVVPSLFPPAMIPSTAVAMPAPRPPVPMVPAAAPPPAVTAPPPMRPSTVLNFAPVHTAAPARPPARPPRRRR